MKRLLTSLCAMAFALVIPTAAFAHTHLEQTTPTDGSTVTVAPEQLMLQFDGIVGAGSVAQVFTSAGEEIEVESISIENKSMEVQLVEPLANDTYKVEWSIISSDGHPLEGSYGFTVQAEAAVTEAEPVAEQPEEPTEQAIEQQAAEESSNSSFFIFAGIVLALIVIGSSVLLLKRKK